MVLKVWTGAYNSLIVIRHPFDRVLSAYRDRIMNKGTGQAINHIPRIFIALKVGINFVYPNLDNYNKILQKW